MPSVFAHGVSASFIAVTAAHVAPSETGYLIAAVIAAISLDLDHVVYVIRDRARYQQSGYVGHLHHARSALHEYLGFVFCGIFSGLTFLWDPKLAHLIFIALAIHLIQDWLAGKSFPLTPSDKTQVQFFILSFKQKILLDVILVLIFGGLWISFLSGPQ